MPVDRKTIVSVAALLVGCAALSGCATPPDQQEPVPLKAGQYAISMNGSVLGFTAKESSSSNNNGAPKSVCLDGTDDEMMRKVSSLVTKLMPQNGDCTVRDPERHGNAIAAGSSCPFNNSSGSGTANITFNGVVAAEGIEGAYSFKVENLQSAGDTQVQARDKLAMASLAAVKLNVHFQRTGDCTAETRSNPWGA